MKIFNVVHEHGQYDERCWYFHGSFSSMEKAEEYINRRCTPPTSEEIEEKFKQWVHDEEKRKDESLLFYTERLNELIKAREKRIKTEPNFGRRKIETLHMQIAGLNKFGGAEDCRHNLEWYTKVCLASLPKKEEFSIYECVLDEKNQ